MARVFVTGSTGFIGAEAVRSVLKAGHTVQALARSEEAGGWLARLGATPVRGDLLVPGPWQEAARSSELLLHAAQPAAFGGLITEARAVAYRDTRLAMDRHLLEALKGAPIGRLVYVAGTSFYGEQGRRLVDEDAVPRPRGYGPYVAPALAEVARHAAAGLPVVTAFPGYVYGAGSWYWRYVVAPLRKRKRLVALWGRSPVLSPIATSDCADALSHLLSWGETGRSYFLVDDRPVTLLTILRRTAQALAVPLRVRRLPAFLARRWLGSLATDSLWTSAALSNARLRGLGFRLRYPTIDSGIPAVIAAAEAADRTE